MNNKQWDSLWLNGPIATMAEGEAYGLRKNSAMAIKGGQIAWLGTVAELVGHPEDLAHEVHDLQGRCMTPGLIDCHTHLVYAGNRYKEFIMRLEGKSYADIARMGGGIQATVLATREVSEAELFHQSAARAWALIADGVTTLEIKSGYGLDLVTELKILRVAKRLGEELPITVKKTFLGAHALPREYQGKAEEYIDLVCNEMLPAVVEAGLADSVDVFCETLGFNLAQTQRVFSTAKKYGLAVRCHAEQLSTSGSGSLAASYQALSVDHLEYLTLPGVQAISQSGTVAVLLPGAFYFLQTKQLPPIAWLREYHVPMAIATDCNPGTSPVTSLLLILNMACTLFLLTPEEALAGVTRHAAKALGLEGSHGTLEVGKKADFVIWDIEHPAELAYRVGWAPAYMRVKEGALLNDTDLKIDRGGDL